MSTVLLFVAGCVEAFLLGICAGVLYIRWCRDGRLWWFRP